METFGLGFAEGAAVLAAGATFEFFGGETEVLALEMGALDYFLGGDTDFFGYSYFTVVADLVTFFSATFTGAAFFCCLGGDTLFLLADFVCFLIGGALTSAFN